MEEIFNMAPADDAEPSDDKKVSKPQSTFPVSPELIDQIDKIDHALPMVRDLEALDEEMDDIAQKAMESYADLMDVGMSTDPRFSGKIFEVASSMLKNAIDARTAKLDKKLKMIDLQIKKKRVDQQSGAPAEEAEGAVYDRTELLKEIIRQSKETE